MRRRSSALRRRYGHGRYGLPAPGNFRSNYDVDPRHAYRATLVTLYNNPRTPRHLLRQWMTSRGQHKAVTDRVLSTAERRGHVQVGAGHYTLTNRGIDSLGIGR